MFLKCKKIKESENKWTGPSRPSQQKVLVYQGLILLAKVSWNRPNERVGLLANKVSGRLFPFLCHPEPKATPLGGPEGINRFRDLQSAAPATA